MRRGGPPPDFDTTGPAQGTESESKEQTFSPEPFLLYPLMFQCGPGPDVTHEAYVVTDNDDDMEGITVSGVLSHSYESP